MDDRIKPLVDDRLMAAYWDGVQHYGTTDLVVTYNTELEEDPVTISRRETMAADAGIPPSLLEKIGQRPKDPSAFWFIALFPDDVIVVALTGHRIGAGGSA